MASHAPGERPHEPRYHVRLTLENAGAGEPSTGETIIDDMVARDDVVITKAHGGARYDGVDVQEGLTSDAATRSVIDDAVDRITVHLRPVETRVEPVEVRVDDIPEDVARVDDVEHDAAVTLRQVVDEYGVESDRASEAARSLATVLYTANPDRYTEFVEEPDAAPRAAYRQLWRRAGVDPNTNEVSNLRPTNDGYEWDGEDDPQTREYVDGLVCPECSSDLRLFGTESVFKCRECGASEDVEQIDGFPDDVDPITHTDIDDADDAVDAARHLLHSDPYAGFPYDERGSYPTSGKPPAEPIREWVEENADVADVELTVEGIRQAIADYDADDAPEVDEDGFIPDGSADEDVRESVEDAETDSKPGTATGRGSWE
jgi:hypothetical protein